MVLPTPKNPRIIALFDVDGTLTIPRGEVEEDMMDVLKTLRQKITVGIVGGSDLPKQKEQLGEGIVDEVVWNFSQNGLVAYNNGNFWSRTQFPSNWEKIISSVSLIGS